MIYEPKEGSIPIPFELVSKSETRIVLNALNKPHYLHITIWVIQINVGLVEHVEDSIVYSIVFLVCKLLWSSVFDMGHRSSCSSVAMMRGPSVLKFSSPGHLSTGIRQDIFYRTETLLICVLRFRILWRCSLCWVIQSLNSLGHTTRVCCRSTTSIVGSRRGPPCVEGIEAVVMGVKEMEDYKLQLK